MSLYCRYINLDRREDRRKSMEIILQHARMSATRFSAIEPTDAMVDANLSLRSRIELADRKYHHQLTGRGAVGCYLSHLAVWNDFLATDANYAVVLEDDLDSRDPHSTALKLQRGIGELRRIANFGIGLLGWEKRNGMRFWGTQAYILTRQGASILVQSALPIEMQVDSYMSYCAERSNLLIVQVADTNRLCQSTQFSTDIQRMCLFCEPTYIYAAFGLVVAVLLMLLVKR